MTNQELKIKLLEMQVEALMSVLSEYGSDHSEFTQWHVAETLAEVLLVIK